MSVIPFSTAHPAPEAASAFEAGVRQGYRLARKGMVGAVLGNTAFPEVNGERGVPSGAPRFVPVDLAKALTKDPPPVEFLGGNVYLPAATKILAVGASWSAKSIQAMAWACKLSRAGITVIFVSQENSLAEDLGRLRRLRPDPKHFVFLSGAELDLAVPGDVDALEELARERGARLIVIDTLTAVWSGDGELNRDFIELDRAVLTRLRDRLGATIFVIDHTGNPVPFGKRKGVHAPRGASSKGQKVDVLLEFQAQGKHVFSLTVAKYRTAGSEPKDATFEVVDTEGGGLDIIAVDGEHVTAAEKELADAMVAAIMAAGALNTNSLLAAVRGGRKDQKLAAMELLRREDPPRVTVARGTVETAGGRQSGMVWQAVRREVPKRSQVGPGPVHLRQIKVGPEVPTLIGRDQGPTSAPDANLAGRSGTSCVVCGADRTKAGAGPDGRCFPCS